VNISAGDAVSTRHWLRIRRTVAVGACCVGVAFVIVAVAARPADDRPVRAGTHRVEARVIAVSSILGGSTGPTSSVEFMYVDLDGVAHDGRLALVRPASAYRVGNTFVVVYDDADPGSARVADGPAGSTAIPWLIPLVLGLVVGVVGTVSSVRLRWTARVLRDNPWVVTAADLVEKPITTSVRSASV
jgi:hypothetical protein